MWFGCGELSDGWTYFCGFGDGFAEKLDLEVSLGGVELWVVVSKYAGALRW